MSHLPFARLLRSPRGWLLAGLAAAVMLHQLTAARAQEESPEPTPTAEPTSTSTPSPADKQLARSFVALGKLDAARGAFLAVIQKGIAGDRLTARYELAKVLLDEGDNVAAADQLDAYLMEAPLDADVLNGQLLLAEALSAQARFREALPLYDAYLSGGGPLASYAEMDRAEALAWLGDKAATAAGERVLASDLPDSTRLQFIGSIANALQQTLPQDAIAWYQRLSDESDSSSDEALAMWQTALIQRELGDPQPWFDTWPMVITRYPDTPSAVEALSDVPPYRVVGDIVDPYYIGLAHYEAGESSAARANFTRSVEKNGNPGGEASLAARANFYLAVLDERNSSFSSAIKHYGEVLSLDPGVDLADDALWWQGRLFEQQGQTDRARAAYEQLLQDYAGSGYGDEARFRLGLVLYDSKHWSDAAATFAALSESGSLDDKARALLWQGKALRAAGDKAQAEDVWRALADDEPDTYYGLRAALLIDGGEGKLRNANIDDPPAIDWSAIQTWLTDVGAGEPAAANESLALNRHWTAARALLEVGMEHRANAEFDAVLEGSLGDPNLLLLLAREFYQIGQFGPSARAASRLLAKLPPDEKAAAPVDLWKVAYPTPYTQPFDRAADESGVSNLLLLALVRQESFFDRLAGSEAGAIGLTQVVGPTGDEIADVLGLSDFHLDDLYQPDVSLRFGAHYLAGQLAAFDSNFYEALAAYNAGPGNALRWSRVADGDVDRFVAEIEYAQTSTYVRLVTENLARYRQLYQGYDEPVLPED